MRIRALCFVLSLVSFAVAEPISKDVPILENRGNVTEILSNNVTGRSFLGNIGSHLHDTTLPFVVRQLGLIECAGLDHAFGGHFFETIMGPGADFGGNYLCLPTCGGECVPTQNLREVPVSIYSPFGCRCAPSRCDAHGPIITPLIKPVFKVVCARDERCTCGSMGPEGTHTGYICNWINLNTNRAVTFLDSPLFPGYPPSYSPIRWCSCCPNIVPY